MTPQSAFNFNVPQPSSFAASRKRKERMDDGDNDGQDSSSLGHSPEQRKLTLAAHHKTASNQVATFHPLGAEENVRMLATLGLLPGNMGGQQGAFGAGSPGSASSANSSPTTATTSLESGYFPASVYPNVQPYAAQQAFIKAQEAAGMDVDPSPSRHGPHCVGLPQLYVSRGHGCALYAKCPSCAFSWEIRSEAQTLSYSC